MPPRPDNAARTHRPRGPSGAARGCEALLYPENRLIFRMILTHYLLRVDGKRDAYNPTTGEGILFGNDAARERMKTETSISILSDQKSRDPRIAKPSGREQAILAITPRAIESALWLSLYGFADIPDRQMDGAYHRSCIVSELHKFDRVIVCRPLANGWSGERG